MYKYIYLNNDNCYKNLKQLLSGIVLNILKIDKSRS